MRYSTATYHKPTISYSPDQYKKNTVALKEDIRGGGVFTHHSLGRHPIRFLTKQLAPGGAYKSLADLTLPLGSALLHAIIFICYQSLMFKSFIQPPCNLQVSDPESAC